MGCVDEGHNSLSRGTQLPWPTANKVFSWDEVIGHVRRMALQP